MSWTSKTSIKTIGWTFIILIGYAFVALVIYLFSAIMLHEKIILPLFPFNEYQKSYYFEGYRKIWQADKACAELDDFLIYRPAIGECRFSNPEFDTKLNFDEYGRKVPNRTPINMSLPGIAVLGDSFAMGWGVEDKDTFSNVLQKGVNRPVFNLGVSSYGTEREIKKLVLSGLLNRVDTIIIQYSDNDLEENKTLLDDASYKEAFKKFSQLRESHSKSSFLSILSYVGNSFKNALTIPYIQFKNQFLGRKQPDFTSHYFYLHRVLKKYDQDLKGKKIMIFHTNYPDGYINFPVGKDASIPNVEFINPILDSRDYFQIDDHFNLKGHYAIGRYLAKQLN